MNDVKRRRFSLSSTGLLRAVLGLFVLIAVVVFQAYSPEARSPSTASRAGWVHVAELPPEARQVLVLIKQGGPFPYAKDGTVFGNREGLLPSQARGYYSEYTVPTPGLKHRGARRIVAGKGRTGSPTNSGEYWYTADHYASFRRIQE